MDKNEIIPSSGDRNLGPVLIGLNWAVFSPSTIIVCLRLITRIWITHNFGWDDAVILLAQMTNAVGMGFVMLEVSYGLGRHKQYSPADHFEGFLKYNYLDWIQVFITLALSKISICLFLLRISKFEKYRYFLFGLIAFLILSHVPMTLIYMLQCIPIRKNWAPAETVGYCFSKHAIKKVIICQGVCSIVTDFIGAAFPIILLWNAKLSLHTKICLNLLMGLGVVTGVVCSVRTSYSWEILADDITWTGVGNALTRILEVNFGIIGACAPIMRPLYLHLRKRLIKERTALNSTERTPASQLQWYEPPSSRPWWKRMWHAPEPRDKLDGRPEEEGVIITGASSPRGSQSGRQEMQREGQQTQQSVLQPKFLGVNPNKRWPMLRQRSNTKPSPSTAAAAKAQRKSEKQTRRREEEIAKQQRKHQHRHAQQNEKQERPENVTWAKKDFDADNSFGSFDFELPMQGITKEGSESSGSGGGGNFYGYGNGTEDMERGTGRGRGIGNGGNDGIAGHGNGGNDHNHDGRGRAIGGNRGNYAGDRDGDEDDKDEEIWGTYRWHRGWV